MQVGGYRLLQLFGSHSHHGLGAAVLRSYFGHLAYSSGVIYHRKHTLLLWYATPLVLALILIFSIRGARESH